MPKIRLRLTSTSTSEGLLSACRWIAIPQGGASKQSDQIFRFFLFSLRHLTKASFLRCLRKTKNPAARDLIRLLWRRKRDSNPRIRGYRSTVFKTAAFNRSAISPFLLTGYFSHLNFLFFITDHLYMKIFQFSSRQR